MSKRGTETASEHSAKKLKGRFPLPENFIRNEESDFGAISNIIVDYLIETEFAELTIRFRDDEPPWSAGQCRVTCPGLRLVCRVWDSRLRDSVIQTHLQLSDRWWAVECRLREEIFVSLDFDRQVIANSLGKWIDLDVVGLPHLIAERIERIPDRFWLSPSVTRAQLERVLALEHAPVRLRARIALIRYKKIYMRMSSEKYLPSVMPVNVLKEVCRRSHFDPLWEILRSTEEFKSDVEFQLEISLKHDPDDCELPRQILLASARPLELIRGCLENVGMNINRNIRRFSVIFTFLLSRTDIKVEDINALPWRSLASRQPFAYLDLVGGRSIMPFQSIYILLPDYLGQSSTYSYLIQCIAAALLEQGEYRKFCCDIKKSSHKNSKSLAIFKDIADILNKKQPSTEEEILALIRSEYLARKKANKPVLD